MFGKEFDRINYFLRPLTQGFEGALSLLDDVALLPPEGVRCVTTDTIVEGIHFIGDESPEDIAAKLVGVNVSDVIAKGCIPYVYWLNMILPEACDDAWFSSFCKALGVLQTKYQMTLAGGDSVRTSGPLVLSMTLIGRPIVEDKIVLRSGANVGDYVVVGGYIGDAYLGLKCVKGQLSSYKLSESVISYVAGLYRCPEPSLSHAAMIGRYAHAAMDISDGLIADVKKLMFASQKACRLMLDDVPISPQAHVILQAGGAHIDELVTGGDDYKVLFTCSPQDFVNIMQDGTYDNVTKIGIVEHGEGVAVENKAGEIYSFGYGGYVHGV